MKKLSAILLFSFLTISLFSQSPDLMTYQMVVRDNAGNIVAGSNVGLRLSILQGSAAGAEVFAETHSAATNTNGLLSVLIGNGINVSGSIAAINWAAGPFFLRAQTDPTGGTNYSIENISQLVSVPYSYFSTEAQSAQSAGNGFSHVSETGDTLYFLNGGYVIIPGISAANGGGNNDVPGCTNNTACNYNSSATQDDGTCYYVGDACDDVNANTSDDVYNDSCICEGQWIVPGCTNNTACNYNSSATQDDGTCYFIGSPCNDGNTNTFNDVYNTSCNCEGSTGTPGAAHSCGAANVHNPNLTYGSMTDQEGNTYKTIVIGTQEWMAENLNTSIYRNGDVIPTGLSNSQWLNTTQGAWAYYNNDASYACPYGKLYNWYACVDARGLCPTGWHVPSDEEWNVLVKYLDPNADTTFASYVQSQIAGAMMKSAGTIEGGDGYWYASDPSDEGTNSSGFSGLPGGYRNDVWDYANMGSGGYWWSSTQYDSYDAWYRFLGFTGAGVLRDISTTHYGWGVRCLRDDGGSGQLPGCTNNTACNYNSSATQDDGSCYFIGSPCNDGNSNTVNDVYNTSCNCEGSTGITGAAHSCGAANVHNPNLTYGSMTDQEGNTYKTIVIGTQEWMAENLNTSIYRNGDAIPTGLSNTEWENTINTQQGAWAYYNNDSSYACPYGKLYNWYACVDARGLCPTDWHVPSEGEWNVLVKYLDPVADTTCSFCTQSTIAGAMMKSAGTIEGGDGYWYADDPSAEGTNSSGFSGLPGGDRNDVGDYGNMGGNGVWWSSTQFGSDSAWLRDLTGLPNVFRNYNHTQVGWGVRCLRD